MEVAALNVPAWLIYAAIKIYRGARWLMVHGAVTDMLRPTRSLAPGCSLTTGPAKVVLVRLLDRAAATSPALMVTNVVDDVSLAVAGPPQRVH